MKPPSNARNVAGQRFGRLVALRPTRKRQRRSVVWRCRCDCGREVDVPLNNLVQGMTQSCGCLRKDTPRDGRVKDETGKQYGRLTVVARAPDDRHQGARWLCRCRCGREVVVSGVMLRQNRAHSCGCWRPRRRSQ